MAYLFVEVVMMLLNCKGNGDRKLPWLLEVKIAAMH
jgi:hypothetical protein